MPVDDPEPDCANGTKMVDWIHWKHRQKIRNSVRMFTFPDPIDNTQLDADLTNSKEPIIDKDEKSTE